MRRIMSLRVVSKLLLLFLLYSCVAAGSNTTTTTTTAAPTTTKQVEEKGSSESESTLVETAVALDGQETRPRSHSYTYSKVEAGYGQPDYGQIPETEPVYGKREKPPTYHYQGRNGGSYSSKSVDSIHDPSYQQYEQRHVGDYSQGSKSSGNKYTQQKVEPDNIAYNHDKYDSPNYDYEEPQKQQYTQNGDYNQKSYGNQAGYESDGEAIHQSKIHDPDYDSNYEHQGGQIYQSKVPEIESYYGSQGKGHQSIKQEEENHSSYGSQEGHIFPSSGHSSHSSNHGSSKGAEYEPSGISGFSHSSYGSPKSSAYQAYTAGNGHPSYGSGKGNSYQLADVSDAGHSSYGSPKGISYQSDVSDNGHSSYGSPKGNIYQSVKSGYGSPKEISYQSHVSEDGHSNYGSPKDSEYQSGISKVNYPSHDSPKGIAYQSEVSGHSSYGSSKGSEYQSDISNSGYPSHGSPKGIAYQSEVSGHSSYGSPKGSEYQSDISSSGYPSHGSPKGISYQPEVSGHSSYGSQKGFEYQSGTSGSGYSNHDSPKGIVYQSEVLGYSNHGSPKGSDYHSGTSGASYSGHNSPKGAAYQSEVSGHSSYGTPKGSDYQSGKGTGYQSEVSGHSSYGSPKGSSYKSGISDAGHSSYESPKGTAYQSGISGSSHSSYGGPSGKSYQPHESDGGYSSFGSDEGQGYHTTHQIVGGHGGYSSGKGKAPEANVAEVTSYFHLGSSKGYRSSPVLQHESPDYSQTSSGYSSGSKASQFPSYSQDSGYVSGGLEQTEYIHENEKSPVYQKESGYQSSISPEDYGSFSGKGSSGIKSHGNTAVFIKQLGHSPNGDKHGTKNGERHGYLLLPVSPGNPDDKIKITTSGLNSAINGKEVQSHSPIYTSKPVYESSGKKSHVYSGIGIPATSSKAFISGNFNRDNGHKSSGQSAYTVQAHKGNTEYSVEESPKEVRYSKPIIVHNVPVSSYKASQGYGAGQGVTVLKNIGGGQTDAVQYVQNDGYEKHTPYGGHGVSSIAIATSQGHGAKASSYGKEPTVVQLPLSHNLTPKGVYASEKKQYVQVPVLRYSGPTHSIAQEKGKIVQAHEYEAKQPVGYSSSDYSSQKQIEIKGKDFPSPTYSSFTPIINPYASVVDFSSPKGSRSKVVASQGYISPYATLDGRYAVSYGGTKTVVAAEKPRSLAIVLQKVQGPIAISGYRSTKTAKANPYSVEGFRPILPQTGGHYGGGLGYSTFHTYTGLASSPSILYKKPSIKS